MLTIRFDRLPITDDTLFLDAGAGFGRHATRLHVAVRPWWHSTTATTK